jgi:hypothetical protein
VYNLTAIYWIKNEARYIPEYIEFHLLQGFDHFIFYDNKSTDGLKEILEPYLDEELVEIKYYPTDFDGVRNSWVMNNEIHFQAGKSRWIHFHATDERLFAMDGRSVIEVIDSITPNTSGVACGGVAIPWTIINSSGHELRPEGLIIENFTAAQRDRMHHIKTVIRPELAWKPDGHPHNFIYQPGRAVVTVNESGEMVWGPFDEGHNGNNLKLFHYLSYSKQEFEERMGKGVLDGGTHIENERRWDADFQWELAHNEENSLGVDNTLIKYVEPVREMIKNRYVGKEHLLERINH